MAVETERKFLVRSDAWKADATDGTRLAQGYLGFADGVAVRVRLAGAHAQLTVKGPPDGISRLEFEYDVPMADAEQMLLELSYGVVEKTRYFLRTGPGQWTVDVFDGLNRGLTVLEIEGEAARHLPELPTWVGEEVSSDPRYANAALARHPFTSWARA